MPKPLYKKPEKHQYFKNFRGLYWRKNGISQKDYICPVHDWQIETKHLQENHEYYDRGENTQAQSYSTLSWVPLVLAKWEQNDLHRLCLADTHWTSVHMLTLNNATRLPTVQAGPVVIVTRHHQPQQIAKGCCGSSENAKPWKSLKKQEMWGYKLCWFS